MKQPQITAKIPKKSMTKKPERWISQTKFHYGLNLLQEKSFSNFGV